MPVIGRRPALALLASGESVLVITEAAQLSIPAFRVGAVNADQDDYYQSWIYPIGTRISYSLISRQRFPAFPIPILCQHRDAQNGAKPVKVFPLHNAVDVSIAIDETTKAIHCMWWWNGWTPDYLKESAPPAPPGSPPAPPVGLLTEKLPKPPATFYAAHSVPDISTPAWLRSLVPKALPAQFDVSKPFWVAPIPEGYQYDYFPKNSVVMGESKVNGLPRIPDTSGGRWLQSMIYRGLANYPGPPEASFGASPSPERDDWERRGGVVAAGEHIQLASKRDSPEFVPIVGENPYTHEPEMANLPGLGVRFPESMTWEDHLIIVNALKAHYDHANLVHSTRVLMYAKGSLLDDAILTTIPVQVAITSKEGLFSFRGPFWPTTEESNRGSVIILEYPRVIGAFPTLTNYRTLINPNRVWYPLQDYVDIGTVFVDDGFLVDGATFHVNQEAGVDWVISDPCDPAAQMLDMYRNHLDNRSY